MASLKNPIIAFLQSSQATRIVNDRTALIGMPSAFPTALHQMLTDSKEAQPEGLGNCPSIQVLTADQTLWLY